MKLDLLAIAPHPDDVELTCGGTMAKMAEAGYATGILDLTRGETGTRGTPETRLREAAAPAKILGAKVRRNLGLPDAHLRVCDEHKVAIAEVIRELEPHTVILPYWEGRHPDHYTSAILGYEACFVAGSKTTRWRRGLSPVQNYLRGGLCSTLCRRSPWISPSSSNAAGAPFLAYESQFRPRKKELENGRKSKVLLPLDELEERMSLTSSVFRPPDRSEIRRRVRGQRNHARGRRGEDAGEVDVKGNRSRAG